MVNNVWVNAETGEKIKDYAVAEAKGIKMFSKTVPVDPNYQKQWVNAKTGVKIIDKTLAEAKGIEVITYTAFKNRKYCKQWVNAETGEKILDKADAEAKGIEVITKNNFDRHKWNKQWVNADTGEKILDKAKAEADGIEVITGSAFKYRKLSKRWVNANTGERIIDKAEAEAIGIEVINSIVFKSRKSKSQWVDAATGEKILDKANAEANKIEVITRGKFNSRKFLHRWVNAATGEEIADKEEAKAKGMEVITKACFKSRKWKHHLANAAFKRSEPASSVTEFFAEKRSLDERSSSSFSLSSVKEEAVEVVQPLLSLTELTQAITQLRGNSNAQENCVHLAIDMLNYMATREQPTKPSCEEPATYEDFLTWVEAQCIDVPLKRENGEVARRRALKQISNSIADRSSRFFQFIPVDYCAAPQEVADNHFDLTRPYAWDVDRYLQDKINYREVIAHLKNMAKDSQSKECFGALNLGLAGAREVYKKGHMIPFYATADMVYFIDGQIINDGQHERPPIFINLADEYDFADASTTSSKKKMYGTEVFIIYARKRMVLANEPTPNEERSMRARVM